MYFEHVKFRKGQLEIYTEMCVTRMILKQPRDQHFFKTFSAISIRLRGKNI